MAAATARNSYAPPMSATHFNPTGLSSGIPGTHSQVQASASQQPVGDFEEPFVSAEEAARYFGINRRFLLSLARKGMPGAYPLGTGGSRKKWIFRRSELAAALGPKSYDSDQGSPR